jgi:hypothetical protein
MRVQNAVAVSAVLLIALSSVARADEVTVGVADTGDCYPFMCNDSGTGSGLAIEYQQVYSSSEFSGPMLITSETFYDLYAQMFGGDDLLFGGNYTFSLSTTSADVNMLGTDLADNLGADDTTVLTYSASPGGEMFGTDFTFTNTTPFLYNPADGNLLLDITVEDQDNLVNALGNSYNDADDTGMETSRAYEFTGDATTAVADSTGLVTTFETTPVPEPSTFVLAFTFVSLLGAGGLLRRAVRHRHIEARDPSTFIS